MSIADSFGDHVIKHLLLHSAPRAWDGYLFQSGALGELQRDSCLSAAIEVVDPSAVPRCSCQLRGYKH